jgi:hypothetical protein
LGPLVCCNGPSGGTEPAREGCGVALEPPGCAVQAAPRMTPAEPVYLQAAPPPTEGPGLEEGSRKPVPGCDRTREPSLTATPDVLARLVQAVASHHGQSPGSLLWIRISQV